MVRNQLFSPVTQNTVVNQGQSKNVKIEDAERPLLYKEWLRRSHSIKRGFEHEEYNNYLAKWNSLQTRKTTTAKKIKEDYKSFIKSLTLFFDDDMKRRFNNDFDLDDLLNLEEIIPYCAEKLRDIMVYYQNKRDAIKRAKLKYNLNGTYTAVERMLHEYILKAFTKHGKYIKLSNKKIYELLPDLGDVNNSLEIKVDELYDDTEYMDKSPTMDAISVPYDGEYSDSYFGKLSDEAYEYYAKQGYGNPEEVNWLIGNGFVGVVGDNIMAEIADESASGIEAAIQKLTSLGNTEQETNDLPSSAYIDFDKTNTIEYYQKKLTNKYLGEDQYLVSGGYYINEYIDLSYNLERGNNWISFPSGEGDFEKPGIKIRPLALSATTLLKNERAIGSKTYVDADKIFIRYGDTVEGAWLRDVSVDHTDETMICNMYANRPFSFRFPYADFGLSGEGIEWSGPGLDNSDQTIYTLPEADRKGIMKAYWEKDGEKSCNAIPLNRTTLVDCGAVADTYYSKADKITVREGQNIHDMNPDGVYTGEKYEAYLYRVSSSDIPILPKRNYIKWPYQNTSVDGLVDLPAGGCEDVSINGIQWRTIPGSRAGYDLFDSDIIYKLDAPDGNPVECAFLSGVPFTNLSAAKSFDEEEFSDWDTTTWTDHATGCFQVGRYTRCLANSYVSFIWLDEDTPMDDVVFHIEHSPDCPYLAEKKYSLYDTNPESNDEESTGITFKEWQKCNCGAIRYSPLGHPGKKFEDYNGFADCCFVDNTHPIPFSKDIWFGDDAGKTGENKGYTTSEDFGWYQLTGSDQVEPDVGWGKGHWVAGANGDGEIPFILRKGKQYKYFRNGIGHSDNDIINGTVPPLVITHKNSEKVMKFAKPTWMRAIMDADGQWQPTNERSKMVIRSDDNLVYDHIDTEWWCITGNMQTNEWTSVDDIDPTIDYSDYLNFVSYNVVPVSSYVLEANWPNITPTPEMSNGNYATLPVRSQIDLVRWVIDYSGVGAGNVDRTVPVNEPMYIFSTTTGDITVSVTGYSNIVSTGAGEYSFDETYRKVDGAEAKFTVHFKAPVTTVHTTVDTSVYTVSAETIGFPLNISLNGWDYDKRQPSTSATPQSAMGARPIWVEGSNKSDVITHNKAVDKWGGGLRFTEEYVPIMQPKISEIVLSAFSPVTYETTEPIKWVQPVEINGIIQDRRWCKLYIDDTKKHVLAESELANPNFMEILASATDETSDIVLESVIDGDDVTINYWANQDFTWDETVVDITNGEAPTGGTYVSPTINKYADANIEYANLSNRHYPTVAVAPVVDNFYGKEDVGGYFVPQYLGASVALSRNTRSSLDTESKISENNVEMINDPATYSKDSGLSKIDNNIPLKYESSYVGWMKSPMMDGIHSGFIRGTVRNQQFMPYKTSQEFRNGMNDVGMGRSGSITDPWKGTKDLTWRSELYDKHFTGQLPIAAVRKTYKNIDKIKDWTHDIYGYSYGLLKEDVVDSDYRSKFNRERFSPGILYVRRSDGVVDKLSNYLTCLKLKDNEFYSLDMCYDTLVLIGEKRVVLYKLVFDGVNAGYGIIDDSSNRIEIKLDDRNFLSEFSLEVENGCEIDVRCAGTWVFPAKSLLDIVYLTRYEYQGKNYYSYIIETINLDTFVRKHRRLQTRTLEPLNLDDPGVQFSVKWFSSDKRSTDSMGRYFVIGPFIDYIDGYYTFVFQLRGDGTTNDKIGRFVRTIVNTSDYTEKWEMVRKVDFS